MIGLLGGWYISRRPTPRLLAFGRLHACAKSADDVWRHTLYLEMCLIRCNFEAVGDRRWVCRIFRLPDAGCPTRKILTTTHYAIGTGLGALFIAFATIFAGIIQSVFGYIGVFVAACFFRPFPER